MSSVIERKQEFTNYLLDRNPSRKFVSRYMVYLNGTVVREYCTKITNTDEIFKITNIPQLLEIYEEVRVDERNVKLHNVYSGSINAYIKYLNGIPLRKMVIRNESE